MTSEVVVMNRLAVALAADSASTVRAANSQKIWNSANKLFALSKCHPVGVMVYNDASILGVPWETIIKTYRVRLGEKSFATLEEYGRDFFEFLNGNTLLFPEDIQVRYFSSQLDTLLANLRRTAHEQYVQAIIAQEPNPDESTVFAAVVEAELGTWDGYDNLETCAAHTESSLLDALAAVISERLEHFSNGITIGDELREKLKRLAVLLVTKEEFGEDYTGVVFAGFGEEEHFPVLQHFKVGGMLLNNLKCSEATVEKVSDKSPSIVTPFAQSQMVDTFMEGINPHLKNTLIRSFMGLALSLPEAVLDGVTDLTDVQRDHWKAQAVGHSQASIRKMLEKLAEYRYHRHWAPVHAALIHLPKDELAHVAEALVNLNSFQKRVSMEDETVGGPIDVAVISKGDGLIWIKRKHYFSRELNEHYFNNHLVA